MNPTKLLLLLPLLILVLVVSCEKEPDLVHPDLEPYFERFKSEAALRGITVDYERQPIRGEFYSGDDRIELGWCATENNTDHIVRINVVFWPALNDLSREKLVFHELGHCFLSRSHLDKVGKNGFCRSIMHSGQQCGDNYNADTREWYLDELFTR